MYVIPPPFFFFLAVHKRLTGVRFYRLEGSDFKVVTATEDKVELSFRRTYNASSQSGGLPLSVDKRVVMLRGSPGFYCYAVMEHAADAPAVSVSEARLAFKLNTARFNYMAVSDAIQRYMPSAKDRESPRAKRLAYGEAVLLVDPANPRFKGEVDDKYQYSLDNKDNKVHGWVGAGQGSPIGFWVVTPSNEFKIGGPLKRELTSHVGPTSVTVSIMLSFLLCSSIVLLGCLQLTCHPNLRRMLPTDVSGNALRRERHRGEDRRRRVLEEGVGPRVRLPQLEPEQGRSARALGGRQGAG
jgi:hypothetical protein